MNTHELPKHSCPHCGKSLDRTSSPQTNCQPRKGDFTVCIGCAGLMVFEDGLKVRLPNAEELVQASKSESVYELQLRIRWMNARKNPQQNFISTQAGRA